MLYQVHFYLKKKNVTAGGMGHWVKVLANKLGELSSNPQGSHGGRKERIASCNCPLTATCLLLYTL